MGSVTLSSAQWTPIGPAPIDTKGGLDQISGRIQAVAPDPNAPTTIYVGGDNGGVWKSTTTPPSWTPLTDTLASLSVSGYHNLVVHPAKSSLVLGLVSGSRRRPASIQRWRRHVADPRQQPVQQPVLHRSGRSPDRPEDALPRRLLVRRLAIGRRRPDLAANHDAPKRSGLGPRHRQIQFKHPVCGSHRQYRRPASQQRRLQEHR